MAEIENHFTVFLRLPFNRGDFIDPPPVAWSAAKESALWNIISRQAKGNEIDWRSLSEQFEVTQSFLLQQAAWLYERQLSQVRAQMRRVGSRQSATPSPAPGSVSASMVGGQTMKRGGSGGSRVPSRLSTQALGSPITGGGDSTPGTPVKSRTSLPFRNSSGVAATVASQTRGVSGTARPTSRQSSKEVDASGHAPQSRRGSIQHQHARSPGQARNVQPQSSGSEDEMTQSRITARRPNPSSMQRRAFSQRKDLQSQRGILSSPTEIAQHQAQYQQSDQDDDDDEPSFLPFAPPGSAAEGKGRPSSSSQQDPSATLRGGLNTQQGPLQIQTQTQSQTPSTRPSMNRRTTSERVSSPSVEPPTPIATQRTQHHTEREREREREREVTSSTSSLSSPTAPPAPPAQASQQPHTHPIAKGTKPTQTQTQTTKATASTSTAPARLPNTHTNPHPHPLSPLSPPHRALLQSSPRRPPGPGSDTSPSMGSSFSDLDDASVTQSALEEALLSGMGNTTMTFAGGVTGGGGGGGGGGVAGRVSGISQALRSRYFDARGDAQGQGQGQGQGKGKGQRGNGNGNGAGAGGVGS